MHAHSLASECQLDYRHACTLTSAGSTPLDMVVNPEEREGGGARSGGEVKDEGGFGLNIHLRVPACVHRSN